MAAKNNHSSDYSFTKNSKSVPDNPCVIGIGASAGGMQALDRLFDNVPLDSVAYVIVQHLEPEHKNLLTEVLSQHSELKVIEMEDNMVVKINTVYILPPNFQVIIRNNTLKLLSRQAETVSLRTVDTFFKSLAEDKKEKAIGIILSGSGKDGTEGIAAIKKAGGLVLVQDPETAKFDAMPRSAINTGLVDYILPVEMMPEEIFNFVKINPLNQQLTDFISHENEHYYQEVLQLVHDRTGIDFVNYKRPTIIRRISRRMAVTNISKLVDYLDFLHLHPEEAETISREFLIGVTKFFRDSEAFEVIQRKVIPTLLEDKKNNDQLRLWVAGCSSGEEAYSLAIIIREYMDSIRKEIDVRIFASDIDRDALDYAGKGLYPADSIAEVSEERLEQFFIKEEGKYRVGQRVRKMVIFAPHNIISDTPFSKIDLVSCRNMLIYLNPLLQKKVIAKFHYALQQGGYLFLGASESIGDLKSFVEVNKRWKIFRSIEAPRALGLENLSSNNSRRLPTYTPSYVSREFSPKLATQHVITEVLNETFLDEFGYAAVYIDENFDLIHGVGDYNKYLKLPDKALTLNLLKMVPADLSLNLGTLLRKAVRDKEKVVANNLPIRDSEIVRRVNMIIKPYLEDRRLLQKFILIVFSEEKPETITIPDKEAYWYEQQNEGRVNELELELHQTKEDLQAVVEELETSNEELQSTNEELLSSNEELQSTNEELQSLNEELHTINAEHQYKIKILMELDDDLNNYFRSTDISQIFLDHKLTIRKFTPAATRQINLIEGDIGRSIYQISNNLQYDDLIEDIRLVIVKSVTVEKEIQDKEGIWYQMRIIPYITQDRRIDGAIVIFIRIHELKNLQLLHSGIIDTSLNPIQAFKAFRNPQGQVVDLEWTMLNTKALEFYNRQENELIGKRYSREYPELFLPAIFERYVQVINTGEPLDIEEQQMYNGQLYWFHLVGVKLDDGLVLTSEDITNRKVAEELLRKQAEELHENAERFRQVFEAFPQMTWTSLPDGSTNSYNQFWYNYTGLTFEETKDWGWAATIHPENAEEVVEAYRSATQNGTVFQREIRIRRYDGTYRWHINRAFPIYNQEGQITLWVGSATDIHDHKTAIEELTESRHFSSQIALASPDFIYVYDLDKQTDIFHNHDISHMLGYNQTDEISGSDFILYKLIHPDDLSALQNFINNPEETSGPIRVMEYRLRDSQGNYRWFRDRGTNFKYRPDGTLCQVIGIAQDVTESVVSQQKLRSERDFNQNLLDHSVDGIVAFDKQACITAWNVTIEELNGLKKEEVLGKNLFDLFPEYHTNDEGKAIQRALEGKKTVLHDHPYGVREGYFETSTIPLFNSQGQVTGGFSIVHEITERKRMEDERINQRLNQQKEVINAILKTQETERKRISEALHNGLGQLLYATKLKFNDLKPGLSSKPDLLKVVDRLLDDAIRETRSLSFELMPSILKDFGLSEALQEVCKRISGPSLHFHCEVIGFTTRLDEDLEFALFRITQELMNNIIKHAKATEASVQITNQRGNIVLRVEDNGDGFDINNLKDKSGVGLSSIRSRLDLLNGKMDIDSEPGKGSTFIIKIEKKKA